jgi:hypothetical protein
MGNIDKLKNLISIDYINKRDNLIYESFMDGERQKTLSEATGLSVSRIKAICNQQKRRIENAISK